MPPHICTRVWRVRDRKAATKTSEMTRRTVGSVSLGTFTCMSFEILSQHDRRARAMQYTGASVQRVCLSVHTLDKAGKSAPESAVLRNLCQECYLPPTSDLLQLLCLRLSSLRLSKESDRWACTCMPQLRVPTMFVSVYRTHVAQAFGLLIRYAERYTGVHAYTYRCMELYLTSIPWTAIGTEVGCRVTAYTGTHIYVCI